MVRVSPTKDVISQNKCLARQRHKKKVGVDLSKSPILKKHRPSSVDNDALNMQIVKTLESKLSQLSLDPLSLQLLPDPAYINICRYLGRKTMTKLSMVSKRMRSFWLRNKASLTKRHIEGIRIVHHKSTETTTIAIIFDAVTIVKLFIAGDASYSGCLTFDEVLNGYPLEGQMSRNFRALYSDSVVGSIQVLKRIMPDSYMCFLEIVDFPITPEVVECIGNRGNYKVDCLLIARALVSVDSEILASLWKRFHTGSLIIRDMYVQKEFLGDVNRMDFISTSLQKVQLAKLKVEDFEMGCPDPHIYEPVLKGNYNGPKIAHLSIESLGLKLSTTMLKEMLAEWAQGNHTIEWISGSLSDAVSIEELLVNECTIRQRYSDEKITIMSKKNDLIVLELLVYDGETTVVIERMREQD